MANIEMCKEVHHDIFYIKYHAKWIYAYNQEDKKKKKKKHQKRIGNNKI